MKSDANKGISLIEYNTYLNKVKQVTWSDGRWLKFNYDGGGSLIKKENSAGEYWNYVGDLIYKNGTFYSINIPEGRAVFENNLWNYEFDYRDIWGNLRVSFSAENGQLTLKQKSDYDALGYTFNQSSGVNKNFFQYQKQQRIEDFDLNVDFFKFRPSDPTIGRFWMVDPLSSQYPHNSVYALQENKFGMGVELEGKELAEFGRYLGGVASGIVEDISLGAFRAGSGTPEYNSGVSAGHKASVAIGGTTTILGTGIVGGSGLVSAGTLGAATPATAVTATAGGALAIYGGAITAKALSSVNSEGNNPHGSKGKPDHQEKVKDLAEKARAENPGKTIVTEKKIQIEGSNRRPDVQAVDPTTKKTTKIYEAERRPGSTRNKKREEEYNRLKIPNETHKVGGQ